MRRLTVTVIAAGCVAASGCGSGPDRSGASARFDQAKALISNNCGACHAVPGVNGANGRVGPPLAGIGSRQILAGHFANTPNNMVSWIEHPQHLLPGDAMPEMGLSHEQAQAIASYLYTLED
jgi:cytochrome c1